MSLYGLDNFYYRRYCDTVEDLEQSLYGLDNFYYRRYIEVWRDIYLRLYGLDNFYYRRFHNRKVFYLFVYTDLIISTIVDSSLIGGKISRSIRT